MYNMRFGLALFPCVGGDVDIQRLQFLFVALFLITFVRNGLVIEVSALLVREAFWLVMLLLHRSEPRWRVVSTQR